MKFRDLSIKLSWAHAAFAARSTGADAVALREVEVLDKEEIWARAIAVQDS